MARSRVWTKDEIEETDIEIEEELDIEDLLVESGINVEELDDIQKEMFLTIQNMDRLGWERGTGYSTGFKLLDEKLMGIQPGLAFLGAQSNVGKSSFYYI